MIILQYHTSLFFCPQNHNQLHFVKLHQSRSQGHKGNLSCVRNFWVSFFTTS